MQVPLRRRNVVEPLLDDFVHFLPRVSVAGPAVVDPSTNYLVMAGVVVVVVVVLEAA